ncbi:polysaccharide deacetylase [Christiangramia gaetbulicola]|uniref:Polysaccharide deacetylase n=1 Tax=Christiangramia gaetbulicola TaxID=703340 RepID=A0A2T6AFM6_9FLAO|nr:polysaccharide deacetylase family protein [Christiangramia gaetbulicola]PTX42630.1 polysaccharide deacetylase [Christiangramia gaetbulicola]
MSKNGYLIISLDFELIWGVFDVIDLQDKRRYFENTIKVIPEILSLFKENDIHCTWAIVGMLFNRNWEEWKRNIPQNKPDYLNEKLSAYNYGSNHNSEEDDSFFFAPQLIRSIKNTKGQEVGTHTYSHYYCLEDSQNEVQFSNDLDIAINVAKDYGIELKSLVFPRNQLKDSYLKICKSKGILNVRSNPLSWYWDDPTSESILVKVARTGDAYLNFGKKSYSLENLETSNDLPLEQPASRFLRPVEGQNFIRDLKIERIKREMTSAAKAGEIYHLWWHPHNFGVEPEESMLDIMKIINHYKELNVKFNFQSLNMDELGALVLNKV